MNPTLAAFQRLPLAQIVAGDNDRTTFDAAGLQELADSIRENGLAQPITVRELPAADGEPLGLYQIVAGERRTRACRLLGWDEIPAFIADLSDEEASAIMLAENLQRRDLSPLETARAFEKRLRQFGWTVAQCAEKSHVKADLVRRRLKLLTLGPEAQMLVEKGSLPLAHAELLADLDANRQMVALRLFHRERPPSLGEFRSFTAELRAAQSQQDLFDAAEFALERLEAAEKINTKTGAGVRTDPRLPKPKVRTTLGATLEDYLADLVAAGHEEAALVVSTLYDGLVRGHMTTVPSSRTVPSELLAA